MNIRLIFVFLMLLVSCCVYANPLDYQVKSRFLTRHYSIEKGLSQSVVNQTLEDELGFLWFATEDGLNRFDGYEFVQFHHSHESLNSLPDNYVTALANAGRGDLWVGSTQGISLYTAVNQQFEIIKDAKFSVGWINKIRSTMLRDNKAYVASENGLFVVDKSTKKITQLLDSTGRLLDDEYLDLIFRDNEIYALTDECILRHDLTDMRTERYCANDPNLNALNKNSTNTEFSQVVAINDKLWVSANDGLRVYDLNERSFQSLPTWIDSALRQASIQHLLLSNDQLWLSSGDSIYSIDFKRQLVQREYPDKGGRKTEIRAKIVSLFKDSQENFWVGIYGKGLTYFNTRQKAFSHLLDESMLSNKIHSNVVHGVIKDDNEVLWMATYGAGLLGLDLMTGQIEQYSVSDPGTQNMLYSLYLSERGRIWIGTSAGLRLFDPQSRRLIKASINFENNHNRSLFVLNIYKDRLGHIWVATDQGLYRFIDEQEDEGEYHFQDFSRFLPIEFKNQSNIVTTILQDLEGNYWIGGYGGLVYGNFDSGSWQHFRYDSNNKKSLSSDSIQQVFQDHSGNIWIATEDGLNRVNKNKANGVSFDRFTTKDGLPSNAIYNIAEDIHQYLILATNKGLVRYSQMKEKMQVFDHRDGISSNEFNTESVLSDMWGLLYFGSVNGVTQMLPGNVANPGQKKKLRIIDFRIDGEKVNISAEKPQLPIKIKVDQNLSIRFSNLDYFLADAQVYRYKMNGVTEKWQYLNKNRSILLQGVPEGEHHLIIQTKASTGSWQGNEIDIPIISVADFFSGRNLLFLIIMFALSVLIASVLGQRYYYKKLMEKREYQVKLESLRLREIRQDNERLKGELTQKGTDLTEKTKALELLKKQIANQSFRDIVTNLLRVDYLYKLTEHPDSNMTPAWLDYQFMAKLKITDSSLIELRQGVLASNELQQQIAAEIKRHLPAEAHIYVMELGVYLVVARKDNSDYLLESLEHLRTRIISSQFKLANGIVVHSDAELEVIELAKSAASVEINIGDLIDFTTLLFSSLKGKGLFRGTGIIQIIGEFKKNWVEADDEFIERLLETGDIVITGHQ